MGIEYASLVTITARLIREERLPNLVFTIIGDDRTGVVEDIARIINEHDANWLGSRMSRLGGKFAGMVEVQGDRASLDALRLRLEGLRDSGLKVTAEQADADADEAHSGDLQTLTVTMLGLDRPGIVREVSSALAERSLNVVDLQTDITRAAMTGRPLFNGVAVVTAVGPVDLDELAGRLEEISAALGVDVELLDQGSPLSGQT